MLTKLENKLDPDGPINNVFEMSEEKNPYKTRKKFNLDVH